MSQRNLSQWLQYLEQLHPSEIELGLERIRQVASRMDVLQPAPLIITVTGTNGKGSTCALVASLLSAQGLRVGLYSSPHFISYNERIVLDGQQATDEQLCAAFTIVEQARQEVSLTYFEVGTLAALWLFRQQQLDVVVLEVGLGGRLDAVNIVDADLAVITSIALDHADWLGETREQVAAEKAGIMRSAKPAICGELQPPAPLLNYAQQQAVPLLLRGRDFDFAQTENDWYWRGLDRAGSEQVLQHLPLPSLPLESAAIALQAVTSLGFSFSQQQLANALSDTKITGRMQQLTVPHQGLNKSVILDVAHNPHAASYIADWLAKRQLAGKRYAVFGALADKDVAGVIAAMKGCIEHWAVAELPSARSCNAQQLVDKLVQMGETAVVCEDIPSALQLQLEQTCENDEILVFGSFLTVAAVLEQIQR